MALYECPSCGYGNRCYKIYLCHTRGHGEARHALVADVSAADRDDGASLTACTDDCVLEGGSKIAWNPRAAIAFALVTAECCSGTKVVFDILAGDGAVWVGGCHRSEAAPPIQWSASTVMYNLYSGVTMTGSTRSETDDFHWRRPAGLPPTRVTLLFDPSRREMSVRYAATVRAVSFGTSPKAVYWAILLGIGRQNCVQLVSVTNLDSE